MVRDTAFSRARHLASRFARDVKGNLAILFSLTLVAFMFTGGMAIDYIRASSGKTSLQAAADAAALAAVVYASDAEKRGDKGIGPLAQAAGLRAWKANANLSYSVADPDIDVKKTGGAWTAKVKFNVPVPTTLAAILGYDKIMIADEATASNGTSAGHNYMEFHIVVDNSASMGLGATQADMDKMEDDPIIGCTFACHKNFSGVNTVVRAKAIGATLRIDVVESALDKMLTTLAGLPNQTKVTAALYGLQSNLDELVPMTGTISDLQHHNLEMEQATKSLGNTNFRASMNTLTSKVGKNGDGSSKSSPQKFAFVVTDGVHDSVKSEPNAAKHGGFNNHFTGPMDPSFCKKIKDDGAILGVLYVDYIVPVSHPAAAMVTPFDDQISPKLQACASDGMFFSAANPADIDKAMADMLATALTKADKTRLTN
jgi:Flp pilus assembly protein TadG